MLWNVLVLKKLEKNGDTENCTANIDTYPNDSHIINYEIPIEGRVRRNRIEPIWIKDYERGEYLSDDDGLNVMMVIEDEPISFEEAVKSEKWRNAMMKEMESIEKNMTWGLTDLPKGVKPIGVKWIFQTKFKETGEINKFKARLVLVPRVARGFDEINKRMKSKGSRELQEESGRLMKLLALDLSCVCLSFALDIKSYVACFIIQSKLQS